MKPVRYRCAECAKQTHFITERVGRDYKEMDFRRLRWRLCVPCFDSRLRTAREIAARRLASTGGQAG